MNVAYRCSCGATRTATAGINDCRCGTRAAIRQNGDVGYQIDLQPTVAPNAKATLKDGKLTIAE